MTMTTTCRWCGRAFAPRGSGKAQHFCRPACRRALDAAGRRYVAEALGSGVLTIADLESGPAATCALAEEGKEPSPHAETAEPDALLSDVLDALPDDAWALLPDDVLDRIAAWLGVGVE